jgi:hypothetical protein
VETDNNISNKFDHSVPPTPLSGGGIFYVCSGSILQPFGAAVAPLDPPFAHGMPALSVVAKFAATYSPRIQMPPRSQDPAAFERSRWRGGRYACDTPDIMGCRSVLNRLSPSFANSTSFSMLQAKVDSIPIA